MSVTTHDISDIDAKKLKIKLPYIYEISKVKHLLFNLTYEDKPIVLKFNKLLIPWIKLEKDKNIYDICLCDNNVKNKIKGLHEIQKNILERLRSNSKYSEYLKNTNLYNSIHLDTTLKLIGNNMANTICFNSRNELISINDITKHCIVNVALTLQHFWIRKNWYGFSYTITQLQLESQQTINYSLFDGSFINNKKNTSKYNNNTLGSTTTRTIPPPPPPYITSQSLKEQPSSKILKPTLSDILNARDKILNKIKN